MPLTAHGEQSALRSHRTPNTAASTAPLPASVTIMIRPSGGVGCESSRIDLVRWQQIFFGKSEIKDSTALSTNRPTGKSPHGAESKFRSCPGRAAKTTTGNCFLSQVPREHRFKHSVVDDRQDDDLVHSGNTRKRCRNRRIVFQIFANCRHAGCPGAAD